MANLSSKPVYLALNMRLAQAESVPSVIVATDDIFSSLSDSSVSDSESEDAFPQKGEGQATKSNPRRSQATKTVSYTHLTLPTIYSV